MADHRLNLIDHLSRLNYKFKRMVRSAAKGKPAPGLAITTDKTIPTIAEIKAFSKRHSLSSLLPYEAYDEDSELYYNTDSVGFMLYAFPATGINKAQLKILNDVMSGYHDIDTQIQITLISSPDVTTQTAAWAKERGFSSNSKTSDIFKMLAKKRTEYLETGKWKSLFNDQSWSPRDYHLIISYSVILHKTMLEDGLDEDFLNGLTDSKSRIAGALRSAGIGSIPLEPALFINLLNGVLNPSVKTSPKFTYNPNDAINEQVLDADSAFLMGSHASTILHSDESYSLIPFHVRQWPKQWAGFNNGELLGSFTNNINRIGCPFIATLVVDFGDPSQFKSKLRNKSLRATQMSTSPISKFVPEWHDRKKDWDFVTKSFEDGARLADMFYQVVLIAPQGQEQRAEHSLKSVYSSIGWLLSKSAYIPVHSLLAVLPMGITADTRVALKAFGHYHTHLTSTAVNCAPWIGEWKGTSTPAMLLHGRRGQVVTFDPYDNKKGNYNIAIAAKSGAGKSFFAQEIISTTLSSGGRAVVIDSGHSYREMASLLNGTYIEFDSGNIVGLNPFSNIDDYDDKHFKEQLPLLKMMICQMAGGEQKTSNVKQAIVERAIVAAWAEHKRKTTITKVSQAISQLVLDQSQTTTAQELQLTLHSYTKDGMYAEFWEGDSNIALDNDFIVLELSGLNKTPDLQNVVLLYLIMRVTQRMYHDSNRAQRDICLIDEAWKLLKEGIAGDFIEEGYRVVRKYNGCFITIVQAIIDYKKTDSALAAFNNSDFKIYLQQSPEVLVLAEDAGLISNKSGHIDLLSTVETIHGQYSEMAVVSPDGLSICRFVIDPYTEKLYSTQAAEVARIQHLMAQGISLTHAVQTLVDESSGR